MEDQALEDGIVFLTQGKREMTLSEAIGRIEIVTKNPQLTRKILEEAERRGVIERDGVSVKSSGNVSGDYRSEVKIRVGEFTCGRCGSSLSTGYFIILNDREWGPFGSTCVKKIMGF